MLALPTFGAVFQAYPICFPCLTGLLLWSLSGGENKPAILLPCFIEHTASGEPQAGRPNFTEIAYRLLCRLSEPFFRKSEQKILLADYCTATPSKYKSLQVPLRPFDMNKRRSKKQKLRSHATDSPIARRTHIVHGQIADGPAYNQTSQFQRRVQILRYISIGRILDRRNL